MERVECGVQWGGQARDLQGRLVALEIAYKCWSNKVACIVESTMLRLSGRRFWGVSRIIIDGSFRTEGRLKAERLLIYIN